MIKEEKIIEMNAEELDKIFGGTETNGVLKNITKENVLEKLVELVATVTGTVVGFKLGSKWIKEAEKSGNSIGTWGKFWRKSIVSGGCTKIADSCAKAVIWVIKRVVL